MKRIAILVALALLSLEVSARSVHYFTYSQATRTVSYLNAQNEMMIYFGYEYELPTYVLINEVWMERVNSSYYELWVYGWDAYTGDEIYMPLDLEGVWLYSGGRMYNAAQYLRFRVDVRTPGLTWYIPPYSPYTRVVHRPGYRRSYHYDIHRHGWMPPAYTYGPGMPPPPLPYYYMRHPNAPAPMPTSTWTPGSNKPTINTAEMTRDHNPSTGTQVRSSHSSGTSSPTRTSSDNSGSRNTGATTRTSSDNSGSRNTGATTRTSSDNNGSRSTGATTRTSSDNSGSRSTGATTRTSTDNSGSRSTGTTPTRSTVESRGTSTSRSSGTTSETRSSDTKSSSTRTSTSNNRSSGTRTTTSSNHNRTSSSSRTSSSRGTR